MMTDLVARAEQYARQHHKGQTRKGEAAEPYITHVHEVAFLVGNFGGDDIAVAGAWLHDVVEDCAPTLDDVIAEFGDEVAALVAEVTDDKALEKQSAKLVKSRPPQRNQIVRASLSGQIRQVTLGQLR